MRQVLSTMMRTIPALVNVAVVLSVVYLIFGTSFLFVSLASSSISNVCSLMLD